MATSNPTGAALALWNPGADEHDPISARTYGFWLYLIGDALLFCSLFASYAVLDNPVNAAGGPLTAQVINTPHGLWQTFIILASVLAYSLGTVSLKNGNAAGVQLGILAALLLGGAFLYISGTDLWALAAQGNGPTRSAFLSVFFTLLLTHGLHMLFGILWMLVMLVQVGVLGFTKDVVGRLLNLRLFWQFQATMWVCVYFYVYLLGGAR
ncbi:cytochrome o ubiquinol oxidase subunit III [Acidocella aquatica]|uniref:Cytochrome o ubiquinol oxidase subunit III n=1 Tax=Acidocella aquatica TaxID=1922313 RepID=A0ABQ6A939_9PROT|nr:cytochrome c oxidase subunit 3 [Acidocella aquatica]GLR68734.1 cytochrome o ubiquinol oxidase subunit III [Acidocella aquatica]